MIEFFKNEVDWNRFFTLVEKTGDELNSQKDRFDKSDILEIALQVFSQDKFIYVDMNGYDHICQSKKIEMKTQQNCLYTAKLGNQKEKTSKIKLMNSLGDSSKKNRDDIIKFDYLLIVDTGSIGCYSAAIIYKDQIEDRYLDTSSKDGVTIQIPTNKLNFVVKPKQVKLMSASKSFSYKDEKRELQRRYIESV